MGNSNCRGYPNRICDYEIAAVRLFEIRIWKKVLFPKNTYVWIVRSKNGIGFVTSMLYKDCAMFDVLFGRNIFSERLIELAKEYCRREGISKIVVNVTNKRIGECLERYGFTKVDEGSSMYELRF